MGLVLLSFSLVVALLLPTRLLGQVPRFHNRAAEAGLTVKMTSGDPHKPFIPESMSGGGAFLDFDRDGWMDLYLVDGSSLEGVRTGRNEAYNRLYRNRGDGTFEDVTEKAGVGDRSWGNGACVGDVDNDGWDDIFVTNIGPDILYRNRGDGTFARIPGPWDSDPAWSSSCGFGDADNDGDLDLYVSHYVGFDFQNPPTEGPGCVYRGVKVQCGPRGLPALADRYYRNEGGGHFVDATDAAGFNPGESYYGLGVIWSDFDGDGDVDVFVANDSVPNFLFENAGDGTFMEVGLLAGVSFNEDGREQAGMGVDFADFDNDLDLDLVVTNFSDDTNTLYRYEGDGHFVDVTYRANLGDVSWQRLGWGVAFVDLDLDGWKDLVIANGHVYPEVDRYEIGTAFRQRNFVFRNLRNGQFEEVTEQAGPGFQEVRNSRAVLAGDVNNDGHVDFVITNLDEEPSLLINDGSAQGHWLLLHLEGTKSNRNAIGARVIVRAGDLVQMRTVNGGGGYQGQSDLRLHFGLAGHTTADEIEIRWPSGRVQRLQGIRADQILKIREPEN
ncbi:MAG: CRTAC1 family protein [Acidobacteriota bacterium]